MNQKITNAVFPVAGLGTRFLPAMKHGPAGTCSIKHTTLAALAKQG